MHRILISGSTGFIGENLTKHLISQGDMVFRLSRKHLNDRNFEQLNQCDTVIHLAGKAHDLKKVADHEEYYEINYELTKDLFSAFLKSDAKKFVFMSSVKSSADSVKGVLTEDITPDPQTSYGKSKLMAEEFIQSQIIPEEKSYFILRPCMVHGPGNKGNLNLLYKFVKKGIPYPLASFENQRSFLSIGNLNFIIKELISLRNPDSGIYQMADDESLSTNQVVEIISMALEKTHRELKIPQSVIRLLARLGDCLKLPLNTESLNKLTENYVVSNQKIKQLLKKSLPISSREGVLITAKSFHVD